MNFVAAASGREYDCESSNVLGMCGRRSKGSVSLGPLELSHCPYAIACSVSLEKLNHCYLLCLLIKTLKYV